MLYAESNEYSALKHFICVTRQLRVGVRARSRVACAFTPQKKLFINKH